MWHFIWKRGGAGFSPILTKDVGVQRYLILWINPENVGNCFWGNCYSLELVFAVPVFPSILWLLHHPGVWTLQEIGVLAFALPFPFWKFPSLLPLLDNSRCPFSLQLTENTEVKMFRDGGNCVLWASPTGHYWMNTLILQGWRETLVICRKFVEVCSVDSKDSLWWPI